MTVWFTSDTHFFHNKDFCYKARGFETVEEMNQEIIRRHNEVVAPDDIVYILGDCGLNAEPQDIISCLAQMNGNKYFIIGNHDSNARVLEFVKADIFKSTGMADRFTYKKITFYVSHYPMLTANFQEDKPIWNIHGHLHSPEHFHENLWHCFQVSMESNSCYPINLDTIVDLIKNKN